MTELLEKGIRVNGKIAELVKARKGCKCAECGFPIEPKTHYYRVYYGGSGLGGIKFPDHVCIDCIYKDMNRG